MTRKDYVLIAGAIAWSLDHHCDTILERHGAAETAREIARVLEQDNPRFDRERFLKAAGVQS